jgi:hypothetical protein
MAYIKTKEEALDALAQTLALTERRQQIIDVNVKIILCLHPEPRVFLADCLAGLIGGGLDQMTREKLDAIEQDVVVIVNAEDDKLFETAARALDALHIAGVACDVFPTLAPEVERWQIARAIILNEAGVRECILAGVKARGTASDPADPAAAETALKLLRVWIDQAKPAWQERATLLRDALRDQPSSELMFNVIATDDVHAGPFLEYIEKDVERAARFAANFADILQTLRRLESESGRPTDSKSFRRVA